MYDKAFTFQRVRNYPFTNDKMNQLEAVEDNANLNLNNSEAINNFVTSAR